MTLNDAAVVGLQGRGMRTQHPEARKYCFQAWHLSETSGAETYYSNQAMARYIQDNLAPEFSQVLLIRALRPTNRRKSLVVPRSVYVALRQGVQPEVDEEDLITVFRDGQYNDLVKGYFRTVLGKTLDFYNCFVEGENGNSLRDNFDKVMVMRAFNKKVAAELRLAREESWGDIAVELAKGSARLPLGSIYHVYRFITSRSQAESETAGGGIEPTPQVNGAVPVAEPNSARNSARNSTSTSTRNSAPTLTELQSAQQGFWDWLTSLPNAAEATATAGAANSYCQMKSQTKTFISLLEDLIRAYKRSDTGDDGLDTSTVWTLLVNADAARRQGNNLVVNLNQTGLLDAVVNRHSATKSTAWALGAVGSGGMAAWGYLALTGPWAWGVILGGSVLCILGGLNSLDHKEYRDRSRQVAVDYASFRAAYNTVARTLALQFATTLGADMSIQDAVLRNELLRTLGIDLGDVNRAQYTMAKLAMDVENLDKTFKTFTENMDWLDKREAMDLNRGVEAE